MAKFLATFNDWSDDIELNGFVIMNDREVLNYEQLASSITWPFTYEFSDGSELNFTSGEDLLSRVDFTEITAEEVKTFKKLFDSEFGFFITEDYLGEVIGEEDEYDDDEEDEDEGYYNDNYQDEDYD